MSETPTPQDAPEQGTTDDVEGHVRGDDAPTDVTEGLRAAALPDDDEDDVEGHVKMRG